MTDIVRLWTSAAFDRAYLCGGWASVRLIGGEPSGFAGGDRRTTERRMLLTGLAAGLRGLPTATGVRIETDNADARLLASVLAGTTPGSEDDLDLWAPVLTGCRGRAITVVATQAGQDTPMAFSSAWADLSRDKAKAKGPFSAAIPRQNLAKVAWPR